MKEKSDFGYNGLNYYVSTILLVFVPMLFFSAKKRPNVLEGTHWTFVGLMYNTDQSLHTCPSDLSYTLNFGANGKLSGCTIFAYSGKYKIRKDNYLSITAFISKGGGTSQNEFECRLNYGRYLNTVAKFKIADQKLEIASSQYITMVFRMNG